MERSPEISVVIPTFNEEKDIAQTLESLSNQSLPKDSYEIIVVDNGSTDETTNLVRSFTDDLFIVPDINVGAVRNYGAKMAHSKLILFLDADCIIPRDHLETCLERREKVFSGVIFGGSLNSRKDPGWVEKYWLLEGPCAQNRQRELTGACILVDKGVLLSLGGFPEDVTSGEDTLFSQRAKSAGHKITISTDLAVTHLGNPKTVREFFKRQSWHAKSYKGLWPAPLKDKVFMLVMIYSAAIISAIVGAIVFPLSPYPLMATQIPPSLLATKRIVRSGYRLKIRDIIPILTLDNMYLLARAYGFFSSIIQRN
ncbi:hypothetical protein CF392_02540 [Tamilnaduibacter salinus]|uniref:Glycosyltransferase 2-like domain-containing protein n=1 Tax=Tamilnaduibacter salinus TaxID=1484056 RepID=A0A2A2I6X8_9GAMM|nr:glycosyltransferase [Tamilnaduibacter salinus]PAV27034.1 hypothetical protein CF392_02540 [Tamilnaduibacter salinus]